MRPSKLVKQMLGIEGVQSACDGFAAISAWRYIRRPSDKGPCRFLDVYAGERRVQVYISPTGRSVRVFVDGKEV